ncbi:lysozyme [Salmonella enterica]
MSENGLSLIKSFEKCNLAAYPDPGSGSEPFTIGWGHTGGIEPGDRITQAVADELFKKDVETVEKAVSKLVTVPVTQNQFDALVSLAFNIGAGRSGLAGSTLLRQLNEGNYREAAEQFSLWIFAKDRVLNGLVTRRAAESKLFMTP